VILSCRAISRTGTPDLDSSQAASVSFCECGLTVRGMIDSDCLLKQAEFVLDLIVSDINFNIVLRPRHMQVEIDINVNAGL